IRELPTAAVTQRDRGELAGRVVVVAERSTGDRVVDHRELTPVGPPEPSDPGAVGAFDHPAGAVIAVGRVTRRPGRAGEQPSVVELEPDLTARMIHPGAAPGQVPPERTGRHRTTRPGARLGHGASQLVERASDLEPTR